MKTKLVVIFGLVLLLAVGYIVFVYLKLPQPRIREGTKVTLSPTTGERASPAAEVDWTVEEIASGLYVPWSIVFTSDERMLVTERNGSIREIVNGQLNPSALITFDEVASVSEAGLMGMELDPDYASNKYIYVCMAYHDGNAISNKIERLIDNGGEVIPDKILLNRFPSARNHAGCRVKFGPDSKLYVTSGDATQGSLAQDLNSLAGKILRMNKDGSVPSDNPFSGSLVYSLGHRNPQGIAWHPSGVMYSTEHGPSGFDGPGGGDEVNVIKPGQNYGWPEVHHQESAPGMVDPKLLFTPAEAPASAMIYTGSKIPQFKNNLFFGALRGEGIFKIELSQEDPEQIISYEKLNLGVDHGRIREVVQGPDGFIYFTTSNRDGRGSLRENDDKIYRFIPK